MITMQNGSDITLALQEELDRLSQIGGGEILIPPGSYQCKPITMYSHITLRLANGAHLTASGQRSDYRSVPYHHNEMGEVFSWLYAENCQNIVICGEGTIDLNASAFYNMDKATPVSSVGPAITQAHIDEAPRTYDWRVNQPIFFVQCNNLTIRDIKIVNAPCWTISCHACHNLIVQGLTIDNSLVIPNNDGMHFCCCDGVIVSDCHVTAGDDCIALSAITDWNIPCQNVVISNCVFQSASKAISIGYMHSIVRNVTISNIIVKGSNRAYVSMAHPGTGLVENINVQNCVFEGRSYGGNWWGNGEAIVLMVTPHHIATYRDPQPTQRFDVSIRNVNFDQIICRAERPNAVVASQKAIKNVRFRNITLDLIEEEKPSLKGNVIDLAPGPVNYTIPQGGIGLVTKNSHVMVNNYTDSHGKDLKVCEILGNLSMPVHGHDFTG